MTTGLKNCTNTFSAASQLDVPRRLQNVVRSQPGYRKGTAMQLWPTKAGSQFIRLYVRVAGQWMDASLQDIHPVA